MLWLLVAVLWLALIALTVALVALLRHAARAVDEQANTHARLLRLAPRRPEGST